MLPWTGICPKSLATMIFATSCRGTFLYTVVGSETMKSLVMSSSGMSFSVAT